MTTFKDLIMMERLPTTWCPGCGIGEVMIQLTKAMAATGLNRDNTVVVSGIGCTGRMAGYLNLDGVYTLHGRALPVAEAIKKVNPALNVLVVSGDGDLASIGGNHLIHVARRNPKLLVICNNNEVYGLTGGQVGPTTPQGTRTVSTPQGNPYRPVDIQQIIKSAGRYFYAKTTVYHQVHFQRVFKEALAWDGFAFIDCTSQCIENNGRRLGFEHAYAMLASYREKFRRAPDGVETLAPFQLGIVKSEG